MALLQGPQLQNASVLGFGMSEEELFILISTSTSPLLYFCLGPLLPLRNKHNPSLSAL